MKIKTIHNTLTQLTRLGVINAYFVQETDGLTLVDTGLSGSGAEFRAAAEQMGAPIRRVLLTHAHTDHSGSVDEVMALYPEAELVVGARTARFIAGDLELEPGETMAPLKGGFIRVQAEPARVVQAGDRVGSLDVIASPGHSPDHLSFFDPRHGTLLAGDAFQTQGGLAVSGTFRLFFPLPALATWHKPTALESARHLRALEPAWLAVGHGKVLAEPLGAIDQAIAAAARRLGE